MVRLTQNVSLTGATASGRVNAEATYAKSIGFSFSTNIATRQCLANEGKLCESFLAGQVLVWRPDRCSSLHPLERAIVISLPKAVAHRSMIFVNE
jgi:hypothetical protein